MLINIDKSYKVLIPKYLKNRYLDINKIIQLVEKNDFIGIKSIAHSMKGSGSMYGVDFISEISEKIENYAEEKNNTLIEMSILEMKNFLDELQINYI